MRGASCGASWFPSWFASLLISSLIESILYRGGLSRARLIRLGDHRPLSHRLPGDDALARSVVLVLQRNVAPPGITAIRFPEFAQDVGVEQKAHHSSMGRSSCGPRTKSLSSPTLGIESKYSLNEGFFLDRSEEHTSE